MDVRAALKGLGLLSLLCASAGVFTSGNLHAAACTLAAVFAWSAAMVLLHHAVRRMECLQNAWRHAQASMMWNILQGDRVRAQISEEIYRAIRDQVWKNPKVYLAEILAMATVLVDLVMAILAWGPRVFFGSAALAVLFAKDQVLDLVQTLHWGPAWWSASFLAGWVLICAAASVAFGLVEVAFRKPACLGVALQQERMRRVCQVTGISYSSKLTLSPATEPATTCRDC